MTRLALLLLAIAACSSKPDRAAGKYQGKRGPIIELRADGTLDMPPHSDPRCDDDKPALDACRAKQRWSRDGDSVTLQIGGVWAKSGGSLGLHDDGPPCQCRLETHVATFDADTLAIGNEQLVRIR